MTETPTDPPPDPDDLEREAEEQRPVTEAGGGEAEGFEQSEEELIDKAEGDPGGGHPLGDAFPPEDEDPEAHTIHGEADELDSSATEDET